MESFQPDFGPYRGTRLLATGSQAQVWLATGPSGGNVAVKVARTPAHEEALQREAELLARLDHPNVVRVIDREPSGKWIAVAYIDGTTFDQWSVGRPIAEVVRASIEVVDALEHLHQRNVVHADLKPSNVLIDQAGHAHLVDLGLAGVPAAGRARFKGTLGYAAPEQLRGEPVSARTDLYGLGALLYACFTERTPFVAPDPAALTYLPLVSLPAPPSAFRPELPAAINQLILALLSRDPARRPATLERVKETLDKGLASKPGAVVLGMLDEREDLRRAVVGAADGEPRVVVLYGPPGSGRRTLIAEAVEYGRREGLPYLKSTDPKAMLAAMRENDRPSVVVLRANQPAARKLAQIVLTDKIPCLMLLHAERPIPALAEKGAIQLTPAPLGLKDAVKIGRMWGAESHLSEQWWQESLGLPIALMGRLRAWRRRAAGAPADLAELPPEAQKILEVLADGAAHPVSGLAAVCGFSEHSLLDQAEVLFAEGLIVAVDDGNALRRVEELPPKPVSAASA